ncbi:MAG: aspartate/glutamate racemase family protein [Sedimentibacter sp.]
MRILIINPNSDIETNKIILEKANKLINGAYEVDCVNVKNAPKLISSYEDYARTTPEMIEFVRQGEKTYDAFIVACHSDPNLDVLREVTNKPVVGIAEASMKIASMMGNSFAVISPSKKSISKKFSLARKYHCNDLLKLVVVSKSDNEDDLLEASKEAVERGEVDAIVLGCANYANADRYIEKQLDIPVLEGVACALILASGLVRYKNYKI